MMYKFGYKMARHGIKSGSYFIKQAKPLLLFNLSARMALYIRLLEVFTRRMGAMKMQRLATFKFKRILFTFRPISKMKDQINFRRKLENQNFRKIIEHMQNLLIKEKLAKLNLKAVTKKKKDEREEFGGILCILAPKEIHIQMGSITKKYKDFCGHQIETHIFIHREECDIQPIREEQFDSENLDDSQMV